MRTELGELGDLDALEKIVPIAGLKLIEAGSGPGDTARSLAERGAEVLGVEPDAAQAEKNRGAPATPGVTFVEAGAEVIPAEDGSADGVLFFRSLHHIPRELMDAALTEAARALKPNGFLYVAEPSLEGSNFAMMRPFNDEFEVRTLAQQALERAAAPLFKEALHYVYIIRPKHEDFAAMANKFSSLSYNPIAHESIDQPEVRKNFEAGITANGYVFEQPMLVNFYRGVRD